MDPGDLTMAGSPFTSEELAEASRYRLEIQWSDEDQVYLASLPELEGIRTHSDTITGAAERGVELAAEHLFGMRALGLSVPAPQSLAVVS
jgi:predicted RNase H-like HicB family nuclease